MKIRLKIWRFKWKNGILIPCQNICMFKLRVLPYNWYIIFLKANFCSQKIVWTRLNQIFTQNASIRFQLELPSSIVIYDEVLTLSPSYQICYQKKKELILLNRNLCSRLSDFPVIEVEIKLYTHPFYLSISNVFMISKFGRRSHNSSYLCEHEPPKLTKANPEPDLF